MNRPRGRPFEPGNTSGRGRPKGSRNKTKSPGQQLFDDYADALTRKCISLGLQGDRNALRLCIERVSPARRDACIRLSLPKIETAQDVGLAAEKVTQAIQRGKITPEHGAKMMNILEMRSRVIERSELEKRIQNLEQEASTRGVKKP